MNPYPTCAACGKGANLHNVEIPHTGMETDCSGFQWREVSDPNFTCTSEEFEGGGGTFGGGGASGGW